MVHSFRTKILSIYGILGTVPGVGALVCSNTHGIFAHGHFSLLWDININKIIIPINAKFITVKRRKEGRRAERMERRKKGERKKSILPTPRQTTITILVEFLPGFFSACISKYEYVYAC